MRSLFERRGEGEKEGEEEKKTMKNRENEEGNENKHVLHALTSEDDLNSRSSINDFSHSVAPDESCQSETLVCRELFSIKQGKGECSDGCYHFWKSLHGAFLSTFGKMGSCPKSAITASLVRGICSSRAANR